MTFTIGRRGLIITATIAVLAIGAGVGYAAIPDSAVIHGCYDKNALRVIDPSTGGACKNTETRLDWGQAGPQGTQGPQGPRGRKGRKEFKGVAGQAGGLSGLERVFGNSATLNQTIGEVSSVAFCPAGKKVISGGYENSSSGSGGASSPFAIIQDYPATTNPKGSGDPPLDFWTVTAAITMSNTNPSTYTFQAIAICANATG